MENKITLEQLKIVFSDEKFINNLCLSKSHDFGFLSVEEQEKIKFNCKDWLRSIENNLPYSGIFGLDHLVVKKHRCECNRI